ncbi:hypothetical protein VTK73DRAFT_430 [Phialemonium thermophilum]|uniref:Protein kinase domain-containing protein n=1 Tax=Phialemonium thermophilum TaxID=223376 RepID=A0ABR3VV72_9PEZI
MIVSFRRTDISFLAVAKPFPLVSPYDLGTVAVPAIAALHQSLHQAEQPAGHHVSSAQNRPQSMEDTEAVYESGMSQLRRERHRGPICGRPPPLLPDRVAAQRTGAFRGDESPSHRHPDYIYVQDDRNGTSNDGLRHEARATVIEGLEQSVTPHILPAIMSDILGAIDASISLAERLYKIIRDFRDAPQKAKDHLLAHHVGAIRLDLLRDAVQQSQEAGQLDDHHEDCIRGELTNLNKDVSNAINYLQGRAPDDLGRRMMWALGAGAGVAALFEAIEARFNRLQQVVDLARQGPDLRELPKDRFQYDKKPTDYKYVTGARSRYCVEADLVARDNSDRNTPRPRRPVLIESYRPNDERNKERAKDHAKRAAQRLWWSRVPEKAAVVPYQTGLLPCLGYQRFRVVFLLPGNARLESPMTLRECIRQTRAGDEGVSLESRFSIALQLAEAVFRIHLAGLAHRSIRSDQILFLAPKEEQDPQRAAEGHGGPTGRAGASLDGADDPPNKVARAGTFSIITRQVTQQVTRRLSNTFSKKPPAPPKNPRRTPSNRTLRYGKRAGERTNVFKRIVRRGPKESLDGSDDDDADNDPTSEDGNPPRTKKGSQLGNAAKTQRVGDVQPGFGSVYLTNWRHANYSGFLKSFQTGVRSRDLYAHPSLCEGKSVQYHMGHDVYSLGVCLLEIGLWDLFVVEEEERHSAKYGPLAEQADVKNEQAHMTTVKKRIEDFGKKKLPEAMGNRYAEVVRNCLTCTDPDGPWKDVRQEDYCEGFEEHMLSPLRNIYWGLAGIEAARPLEALFEPDLLPFSRVRLGLRDHGPDPALRRIG